MRCTTEDSPGRRDTSRSRRRRRRAPWQRYRLERGPSSASPSLGGGDFNGRRGPQCRPHLRVQIVLFRGETHPLVPGGNLQEFQREQDFIGALAVYFKVLVKTGPRGLLLGISAWVLLAPVICWLWGFFVFRSVSLSVAVLCALLAGKQGPCLPSPGLRGLLGWWRKSVNLQCWCV